MPWDAFIAPTDLFTLRRSDVSCRRVASRSTAGPIGELPHRQNAAILAPFPHTPTISSSRQHTSPPLPFDLPSTLLLFAHTFIHPGNSSSVRSSREARRVSRVGPLSTSLKNRWLIWTTLGGSMDATPMGSLKPIVLPLNMQAHGGQSVETRRALERASGFVIRRRRTE